MRAVADTNIFISAFLFGGLPQIFLELAIGGSFSLVTSGSILEEFDDKLKTKFAVPDDKRQAFLGKLTSHAVVITPSIVLNGVPEDPDDNRILECAVEGKANCIVTGDRHLLRLNEFRGIPIVTVRSFLQVTGLTEF